MMDYLLNEINRKYMYEKNKCFEVVELTTTTTITTNTAAYLFIYLFETDNNYK